MKHGELQTLASRGEGLHLEFKKKIPEPEKLAREAIAFTNTKGGKILVGVEDNGELWGLKFPDEEEFEIRQIFSRLCSPDFHYSLEHVPISSTRTVIIIDIPESPHKPQYYRKHQSKEATIRQRDKSIVASRETIKLLKLRLKNKGITIRYTPRVSMLLKFLEEHPQITVKEFAKTENLPLSLASDLLVRLVYANVLKMEAGELEDHFSMAD